MVPKDVDYEKIGQRIRKRRIEKGLTQAELSAMVDCSNNHLSHIETAQCKVSLGMLLKLSYALESSIDYFLMDTPYVPAASLIDGEIAEKLKQCSAPTLVAASQMIDILLQQQKMLSEE